jgi:hypothetical protein
VEYTATTHSSAARACVNTLQDALGDSFLDGKIATREHYVTTVQEAQNTPEATEYHKLPASLTDNSTGTDRQTTDRALSERVV